MYADGDLNPWDRENDLFREDFFLVPHEEEIRARAEQVLRDNRDDYFRHFVELAIWGALDQPDYLKDLMTLLWHWNDVDPKWMAEASFMSVSDVRDIAEARPLWSFYCLGCNVELTVLNRRHGIRLKERMEEYCSDTAGNDPPAELFCRTCEEQKNDLAEQQRRLDRERYETLLAEYRAA